MKIVKLVAENIKKIKAVEIIPDKNVVVISGKNGAGKTSVLDSIWFALGGTKNIDKQPIRKGQEKAMIKLDLGKYIVTRTFTKKNTYLTVENAEGATFKSPQALLDNLIGNLSFDPLAFIREQNKEKTLMDLTGLGDLLRTPEEEKKGIYEERTIVNREIKNLEGQLTGYEDIPEITEEISITELMVKLQKANEKNAKNKEIENEQNEIANKVFRIENEITGLEIHLTELRESKIEFEQSHKEISKTINEMEDVNIEKIQSQITEAQSHNTKFHQYQEYKQIQNNLVGKQKESEKLTGDIKKLNDKIQEAIETAKFPLKELSFKDNVITYNDIPLEQISDSEKLKVSIAIAMALNPDIRVIRITDGSLLDSENMEIIKKMITDKDFQIWIEKVDESGKVGIVIEDGQIKKEE